MFHRPQETIGFGQLIARIRRDPVELGKRRQRVERPPAAQLGDASAGDQLLGLGEELHLADAAASQLDVVSCDRDPAMALVDMDLPLDRVHVGNRRIVEVLAPDEGRDLLEEALAARHIAGAGPRLDQGRAFPVLAEALVIDERGGDRHGERRRAGVGAQPQVRPEDVAVRRAVAHHLDQPLGHAHELDRRLRPARNGRKLRLVHHDQVDVGGIVQLQRAIFTHGEDDEAAALFRGRLVADLELAAPGKVAQAKADRRRQRGIGEPAEPAGHRIEVQRAGNVGKRQRQREVLLQPAQAGHHRALFLTGQLARLGNEPVDPRLRALLQQRSKALVIGKGKIAQVRRVGQRTRQERTDAFALCVVRIEARDHIGKILRQRLGRSRAFGGGNERDRRQQRRAPGA